MITFNEALFWVVDDDHPRLSQANQQFVNIFSDLNKSAAQRDAAARSLAVEADKSEDLLERGEAWLVLGGYWKNKGKLDEAESCLVKALSYYAPPNDYRYSQAATNWLIGIVQWQRHFNHLAIRNWREARWIMTRLIENAEDAEEEAVAEMYLAQLYKMETDLSGKAEEAYTWLDIFERYHQGKKEAPLTGKAAESDPRLEQFIPSLPSSELREYRNRINDLINKGELERAKAEVFQLEKLVDSPGKILDKPVVFLECGLFMHQLLEHQEAVRLIRWATQLFAGDTHRQAAARWMLGAAQLARPDGVQDGITNWSRSIAQFEELVVNANQTDRSNLVRWYNERLEYMRKAILETRL